MLIEIGFFNQLVLRKISQLLFIVLAIHEDFDTFISVKPMFSDNRGSEKK